MITTLVPVILLKRKRVCNYIFISETVPNADDKQMSGKNQDSKTVARQRKISTDVMSYLATMKEKSSELSSKCIYITGNYDTQVRGACITQ